LHNLVIKHLRNQGKTPRILNVFALSSYKADYGKGKMKRLMKKSGCFDGFSKKNVYL